MDYTINVDGPLAQWSPPSSPTESKPVAPSSSRQPEDEQYDVAFHKGHSANSNEVADLYDETLVLDNKPTLGPRAWSNFKKAMVLVLAIAIVLAATFGA